MMYLRTIGRRFEQTMACFLVMKSKRCTGFFQLQRARHNSLRAARAKKAMQDLSRLQNSRERDKKNNLTRSNNLKLCRKKLPFYSGVSQKVVL